MIGLGPTSSDASRQLAQRTSPGTLAQSFARSAWWRGVNWTTTEAIPVSRLGTGDTPRGDTRIPNRFGCRRRPNPGRGGIGDRKNFGKSADTPNKPFFLASHQRNHAGCPVLKNTAFKSRQRPEAGETVHLRQHGLGFHKGCDLTKTTRLNVTGFQRAFTVDKWLKSTH